MFKKGLTVLLLASALFSGQLFATNQGHEYLQVQDADHLLRHTADSDELRVTAEESAADLREHHHWQ
ncbi:TPA: DUF2554 family protein, partial [Citrobacter freundii]|nr:DUF2554 family protein [Citrobacter freundii]